MRAMWWKILGILILIYTVIAGMSIPIKPGIERVDSLSIGVNGNSNTSITSGETHIFRVEGYNTNYEDNENAAWLKLDSIGAVKASKFESLGNQEAHIHFELPTTFPARDTFQQLTMIIYNVEDGPSILPDAVTVETRFRSNENLGEWTQNPVAGITDKPGIQFPYRSILNETIRNTFFHIPLWFSMFILLIASLVYSVKYLRGNDLKK